MKKLIIIGTLCAGAAIYFSFSGVKTNLSSHNVENSNFTKEVEAISTKRHKPLHRPLHSPPPKIRNLIPDEETIPITQNIVEQKTAYIANNGTEIEKMYFSINSRINKRYSDLFSRLDPHSRLTIEEALTNHHMRLFTAMANQRFIDVSKEEESLNLILKGNLSKYNFEEYISFTKALRSNSGK